MSSKKDSKYNLFLNYMHNELHITKEDIHEWTKEAVNAIVIKYINEKKVKKWAEEIITYKLNYDYSTSQIVKSIKDNVVVTISKNLTDKVMKEIKNNL